MIFFQTLVFVNKIYKIHHEEDVKVSYQHIHLDLPISWNIKVRHVNLLQWFSVPVNVSKQFDHILFRLVFLTILQTYLLFFLYNSHKNMISYKKYKMLYLVTIVQFEMGTSQVRHMNMLQAFSVPVNVSKQFDHRLLVQMSLTIL